MEGSTIRIQLYKQCLIENDNLLCKSSHCRVKTIQKEIRFDAKQDKGPDELHILTVFKPHTNIFVSIDSPLERISVPSP